LGELTELPHTPLDLGVREGGLETEGQRKGMGRGRGKGGKDNRDGNGQWVMGQWVTVSDPLTDDNEITAQQLAFFVLSRR